MQGHATRAAWLTGYLVVALAPLALSLFVGRVPHENLATELSLATGLVALSLLVVAFTLPARVRTISSSFGIEVVLRGHRFVAIAAALLVLAHLVLVVLGDPRGLAMLDLRHAPPRVWAATTSTVALFGLVVLALTRRRRQPRYEGWRMVHVGLAAIVLVAAGLHVWWLHDLVANRVMRWWFLALGLFTVAVAARRWLWLPLRARHRSYVVEEVRPTAGAAVTITVRAHEHEGLPFRAGQFAWLKIGASPFVFEEHPFTIASTAERPHRKEFTIKALGDFSELIAGLRPGRRVYLDGPYGGFTPNVRRGPGLVLIAGGVGITPMLSILRTFADRRDRRHHRLIVGARSVDDLVRRNELDELSSRLWLTVTEVVQQAPPGFQGETGRIDLPLLDRLLPPRRRRHHDYYLCGPPAMVAAVGHELRDLGVPTRRIHTEQFEVV